MHVGFGCPVHRTQGFPESELTEDVPRAGQSPRRSMPPRRSSRPPRRAERYVPRPYWLAAAFRVLTPGLTRRVMGGGAARVMTTTVSSGEGPSPDGEGASLRR